MNTVCLFNMFFDVYLSSPQVQADPDQVKEGK